MKYVGVIKALRGKGVMLEVGDVARQAVEVVRGFIWDVFFNDEITLLITFKDENVLKLDATSKPLVIEGKQVYERYVEFYLKWIRTENILTIESDANVKIAVSERKLNKLKADPLYTDSLQGWPVLNNALSKHISTKLKEMGLDGDFKGIYRNENNDQISLDEVLAAAQAPVMIGIPASIAQGNTTGPATAQE